MVREYTIIHEPYGIEWLMRNYPPGSWETNVRLGRTHPEALDAGLTEEEKRSLMPWWGCADAVIHLPDRVIIVEFIVRPEWEKAYKLKDYAGLFRMTERYKDEWGKPIELVAVTPLLDPYHQRRLAEEGIRYNFYTPPQTSAYYETLRARQRRPSLTRGVG